jgi:hypothetical protein
VTVRTIICMKSDAADRARSAVWPTMFAITAGVRTVEDDGSRW